MFCIGIIGMECLWISLFDGEVVWIFNDFIVYLIVFLFWRVWLVVLILVLVMGICKLFLMFVVSFLVLIKV